MFPYIDHLVVCVPDKPPLLHHMTTCQSNLLQKITILLLTYYYYHAEAYHEPKAFTISAIIFFCYFFPFCDFLISRSM